MADLEEDVEDPGEFEDWEGDEEPVDDDSTGQANAEKGDRHVTPLASVAPLNGNDSDGRGVDLADLQEQITNIDLNGTDSPHGAAGQDRKSVV